MCSEIIKHTRKPGKRHRSKAIIVVLVVFKTFFSFAKSAAACGETCSHLIFFLVTAGDKINQYIKKNSNKRLKNTNKNSRAPKNDFMLVQKTSENSWQTSNDPRNKNGYFWTKPRNNSRIINKKCILWLQNRSILTIFKRNRDARSEIEKIEVAFLIGYRQYSIRNKP